LKIYFSKIKIAEKSYEVIKGLYIHFCSSPNSSIEKSYWGYASSLGMRKGSNENGAAASQIPVRSRHINFLYLLLPLLHLSLVFSLPLFSLFTLTFLFFSHSPDLLKLTTSTEKKPLAEVPSLNPDDKDLARVPPPSGFSMMR
jgi:hypothetical protein